MEEERAEKTKYMKQVGCPGCGKPLALELMLSRMNGDLYAWFEGLCTDCCHKAVDPMPKLRAELSEIDKKIMSN